MTDSHLHRKIRLPRVAPPGQVPKEGETFNRRVDKRSRADYLIDHETGCWNWQRNFNPRNGRPNPVLGHGYPHRIYYALAYGPIPEGHHIHHKCRNGSCVNPEHLEPLPPRDHHIEHFLTDRGLTLDDVRAIRELGRQPGASQGAIAKQFGTSRWTVRNYWNDRTWADLFGEDGPVVTPPQACLYCGKPAVGEYRNKKYCSPQHRSLYNNARRREAA